MVKICIKIKYTVFNCFACVLLVMMSALQHKHIFEGVILTVEPYLDRMLKSDKHFEVLNV